MRDLYCGFCYMDVEKGGLNGSCLQSDYNNPLSATNGRCNHTGLPGNVALGILLLELIHTKRKQKRSKNKEKGIAFALAFSPCEWAFNPNVAAVIVLQIDVNSVLLFSRHNSKPRMSCNYAVCKIQ